MRALVSRAWSKAAVGGFWAAVLLVLPNCSFSHGQVGPARNLPLGAAPHDAVLFCDIEKALGRRCATSLDKATGIRLSEAAIALAEGRTSNVGLDDSAAALAKCGGDPEAIVFEGAFPRGLPVCLNCGIIGSTSFPGDNNAACKAACYDLYGFVDVDGTLVPENPPNPSVKAFCDAQAKVATNFPVNGCFAGSCSDGTVSMTFSDPRAVPDPVSWTALINVAVAGLDLVRTTPFTANFDAGAASVQHITRGDAYVEFTSGRNDQAQALGLTEIGGCGSPCPDLDPSLANMGFGIVLNFDGRIYIVVRGGILLTGPQVNGSFGTYTAGQRFRVKARDNGNGTATMSFLRVDGPCAPGTECPQTTLYTHAGPANYPLRVDASIRDPGALLVDARLVHIK